MIDPTSASSIQSMMETIRSYQSQAAGSTNAGQSAQQIGQNAGLSALQAKTIQAPTTEQPNFTESVRNLLNKVNDVNVNSERMADAYQRGEDIPLTDVVLGMQKASLSFEATLQVRNKVLKAYEDIMNMPV
jgi:flagellar hook-basal body complex protein FliE